MAKRKGFLDSLADAIAQSVSEALYQEPRTDHPAAQMLRDAGGSAPMRGATLGQADRADREERAAGAKENPIPIEGTTVRAKREPVKGQEFAQGKVTKIESEGKPASGATIAGYGDVMAKAKRLSAEQRAKPRAAPSPRPTPQESPAPRMPEMAASQLAMAPDQAPERLFAPSQPAPVPIQGPGPRMAGPVAMPPTTQQAMASATVPSPGGTSPPAPPLGDAQQQFIQAGIAAGVFASAEEGHALLRSKVMMR